jgi:hypothetical protein
MIARLEGLELCRAADKVRFGSLADTGAPAVMSALAPKADIPQVPVDVRFVPSADVRAAQAFPLIA